MKIKTFLAFYSLQTFIVIKTLNLLVSGTK